MTILLYIDLSHRLDDLFINRSPSLASKHDDRGLGEI